MGWSQLNYWNDNDVVKNKELGVSVLFHCTNTEVTNSKNLPSNTYIVGVRTEEQEFEDIAQGSMTAIFDAYYDKFGSEAIRYIKVSKGKVNPRMNFPNKKEKKK